MGDVNRQIFPYSPEISGLKSYRFVIRWISNWKVRVIFCMGKMNFKTLTLAAIAARLEDIIVEGVTLE
ncbi:MAG: hypothetical protein V3S64_05630, partial [bacterium]